MKILLRACWLAGPFGLAVLLVLPAGAQKTTSPGDQSNSQNSLAYQHGYQQGLKDRRDNLEPDAGYGRGDSADRPAYNSGYRAGYCRDEASKTGYYTGAYHDYAPPVMRNGYYGYNAPSAYCEKGSGNAARHPGDPKAQQNRVEYGGGG
ncbi:MAG: hypothetical protein ACLPXM_20585 [Terriglobales bacterium]